VVDLLTDSGKLNWLSSWASFKDFVLTHRHWDNLSLEGGGQVRNFQLSAHSLVGFHVEALDAVSTINFGHKLRMERDDNSGGDENTLRVQGTSTGDITTIKWQFNARNLPTMFVITATLLVKKSLDINVSFEWVASIEVNSDGSRSALNFGLPLKW
jgi:hypothetical protein